MGKLKEKENLIGLIIINILEVIKIVKKMVLEFIIGIIIFFMKEIGLIIFNMVKVFFLMVLGELKEFLDLEN